MVASFATFFPMPNTYADSPGAKKQGCVAPNYSLAYTSPFSQTSELCLGEDGQNFQFYQFVVDMPAGATSPSVTGKSGSGTTIDFVKQDDNSGGIRYVSKETSVNPGVGYATLNATSASDCDTSNKMNSVSITANGNGKSQKLDVDLCSYWQPEKSVIYKTADTLTAANAPKSTKGTIKGNLSVYRESDLVPEKWKNGPIQGKGLVSIKLTGVENKEWAMGSTQDNTWFGINPIGMLTISNLEKGSYGLTITYNDQIALTELGGNAGGTESSIVFSYTGINVPGENGEIWIGGSTATQAQTVNSKGNAVTVAPPSSASTASTCVIDGVGWIVCSVASFLGSVADGIYGLIENLLRVPIVNTDISSGTNGVYNTWMIMRNLANTAFVIGFLIIIFSQLTGIGVSNYGVKKTLPRMVIAAILVNISFWVSAVAVDLSNILGAGLYDLFSQAKGNMNIGISSNWGNIIVGLLAGSAFTVTATAIVVGTAGALLTASGGGMALVFLALPLVLAAVLAVFLAAFVLIARQALVIILIIVSPLAFVALLLPNTESLFKKWKSALISLLLMYPIMSIVFGGAQIAGLAIISTVVANTDPVAVILAILIGQTVMVVPFFLLPTLIMKFSGNSLNGITANVMSKGKSLMGGAGKMARKEGRGRFNRSINTMKYGDSEPTSRIGRAVRRYGGKYDQTKDQQGNADKYLTHERNIATRERLATDPNYATASAAGSEAGGKVLQLRAEAAGQAEDLQEAKAAVIQTNMTGKQRQQLAMTGELKLIDKNGKETVLKGDAMQRAAALTAISLSLPRLHLNLRSLDKRFLMVQAVLSQKILHSAVNA